MREQPSERVLSSKPIYSGRIINLRVDTIELPGGRTTTREIVEHPGAVVIVALDDVRRVAMVRQYRSAIGRVTLEVPAGTRERGEDAASCAARELGEEMGVSANHWFPLVGFFSSPGFCNEFLDCFVATGITPSVAQPEDDEAIQRIWVPVDSVPSMIAAGELGDAKSIASLLTFLERDEHGAPPWRN